eukprot:SAG31_NODE_9442_length_1277_cov_0.913413_2_plen_85_part_00
MLLAGFGLGFVMSSLLLGQILYYGIRVERQRPLSLLLGDFVSWIDVNGTKSTAALQPMKLHADGGVVPVAQVVPAPKSELDPLL